MILVASQRRYGYGAARLPIGRPVGGVSMSALARQSVDREAVFAAFSTLLCAGVVFVLAMTSPLEPHRSARPAELAETPAISIQLWSEASTPESPVEQELPITTPRLIPSLVAAVHSQPAAIPETQSFDSTSFAMRPLLEPTPDAVFRPPPPTEPRPSALALRVRPELDLTGLHSPSFASLGPDDEIGLPDRTEAVRPRAIPVTGRDDSMPEWSPSSERRAFLDTLLATEEASAHRTSRADPRPPAIAAARSAAGFDSVHDELARGFLATGWHEVPLDALPDCNPPGRQDLLKKRILLAAPTERECSHQDGSYRFIETRNLGAFLMWSRPNPDHPAGQQRARDVCDVLQQALRCLDLSSIEESSAQ